MGKIAINQELLNTLSSDLFIEYEEKLKEELKEKKEIAELIMEEDLSIKKAAEKLDSYFLFSVIFKKLAPEASDEVLISIVDRIKQDGNVSIYSTKLMQLLDEELERYENVVIVEDLIEKEAYIKLDEATAEENLFIIKTKEEIASISESDIKTITFAMKKEKLLTFYVDLFKSKGIEVFLEEPTGESFLEDLKNYLKS